MPPSPGSATPGDEDHDTQVYKNNIHSLRQQHLSGKAREISKVNMPDYWAPGEQDVAAEDDSAKSVLDGKAAEEKKGEAAKDPNEMNSVLLQDDRLGDLLGDRLKDTDSSKRAPNSPLAEKEEHRKHIATIQEAAENRAKEDALARQLSQKRVKELADKLSTLQAERAKAEQCAASELSRLETKLTENKRKSQRQISDLSSELDKVKSDKRSLQAVVSARTSSVMELQNEMLQLEESVHVERMQARDLEIQLHAARGSSQELSAILELTKKDHEALVDHMQEEKEQLKGEVRDLELNLRELQVSSLHQMEHAEEAIKRASMLLEEEEAKVEKLEGELFETSSALRTTRDTVYRAAKKNKELEATNEGLQKDLLQMKEQNQFQAFRIGELETNLRDANNFSDTLKQQLEEEKEESERVKEESERVREQAASEVQAVKQRMQEAKEQFTEMASKVEENAASAADTVEKCTEQREQMHRNMEYLKSVATASVTKAVTEKAETVASLKRELAEVAAVAADNTAKLKNVMSPESTSMNPAVLLREAMNASELLESRLGTAKTDLTEKDEEFSKERASGAALMSVERVLHELQELRMADEENDNLDGRVHELQSALKALRSNLSSM
ncbi:hypothetical protein CYMTET_3351 [Cymbomonas tetramitiformis]|uniref:Uncharacterized protein n=1 Tax=Cymbomonas tetramitiformis TaxID=36881 RepID=A0AAE0LLG1_9CHLO|nr:hypothetical protein CYMTET_3351 [Cymbomonas tetramitiformis]